MSEALKSLRIRLEALLQEARVSRQRAEVALERAIAKCEQMQDVLYQLEKEESLEKKREEQQEKESVKM